ncbi:MAG TPA: 23S rRNA (adenine(2503)-C(2))-methyltransferase RlmN [Blastocatellia bacterium]
MTETGFDRWAEFLGFTEEELSEHLVAMGERPYRARQLYQAIHCRRITSLQEISELPGTLKASLAEQGLIISARIERVFVSSDGARRYLIGLRDGLEIESVFIPEPDRDTICISSQAGCPLACQFCVTGILGLKRNLSAGEIVSQVVLVLNQVYGAGNPVPHGTNIVMMGMGEPLLNYDNAMKAVRLLADDRGLNISAGRITLSTAGVVPRIYDLAREEIRPQLAISLTAATDELRDRLLPINRKYPLADLMEACRKYPLARRERLTFEYVMLDGVNDSAGDARLLVKMLSRVKAKVNLIGHNPSPELEFKSTPGERILAFQRTLTEAGLPAFIRRPRGQDVSAACGQLAARR